MSSKRDKINFVLSHVIFLLSLIVVYSIPHLYPIVHEKYLPPMNRPLRFYIIGVFSVTFLAYYLCIHFYKKTKMQLFKPCSFSVYFWGSTILVFIILCGSSALLSHDLFEYSIRARMLSIYRLNPYLHVPMEIKNDIFFPLIFWKNTPECYGSLWVLIGVLHTFISKNNIAITSFMHKFILLIFLLLSSSIFYKLCKEIIPEKSDVTTLAFLLNPLVLIMTIVDGHNEITMTFFMLFSLYLLVKSRYVLSLMFLAFAINVKFIYVLIIPLFVLHILFSQGVKEARQRVYELSLTAFLCTLIFVILWVPFGLEGIRAAVSYYMGLAKNFWVDSIPYAVYFVSGKIGLNFSKNLIANIFSSVFAVSYLCILAYFLKNIKRDRQALFTSSAFIFLALLFTNSTPFQAWYLIWIIPFIFLSNIRLKFQLVFLMSYFLIMTFWKRMFVLAVPLIMVYFFMLLFYRNSIEKTTHKNA